MNTATPSSEPVSLSSALARQTKATVRPRRILLYSHDSFGLGHLRRSLSIADALVREDPDVGVVIISGSPVSEVFQLPPRCGLVKIPAISKDADGKYVSRGLPLSLSDVTRVRSELIATTTRTYAPDVILIDHTAEGPGKELLLMLREVRARGDRTRVFLGIRDVIDAPATVRRQMLASRTYDCIARFYDTVFIYGDPMILDVAAAYALPPRVIDKLEYVGIASPGRAFPAEKESASARAGDSSGAFDSDILVTAGGGEDGEFLLRAALAAVRGPLRERNFHVTLVTGPLMPSNRWQALQRDWDADSHVRLIRHVSGAHRLIRRARLVVTMGGYNSVYESLQCGARTLVVPRVRPRKEQLERGRRLSGLGLLDLVEPADAADPGKFAAAIERCLDRAPASAPSRLRFDGARRAAQRLLGIAGSCDNPDAIEGEFSPCA